MDALEGLLSQARAAVAGAGDLAGLDDVRVRFLGKKGEITALLKNLGNLPADQRPAAGQAINRGEGCRARCARSTARDSRAAQSGSSARQPTVST